MLESQAQIDWDESADRIAQDPDFSGWLKLMVKRSLERPTLLAARDAAVLLATLRGRRNELATGHPLVEPRRADPARTVSPPHGPPAPLRHATDAVQVARRILRDDSRPRLVVLYLDSSQRPVGHTLIESRPHGFDGEIVPPILEVAERLGSPWLALIEVTLRPRVAAVSEAFDLLKVVRDAGASRGVRLRDYIRYATNGGHHSLEEDGGL